MSEESIAVEARRVFAQEFGEPVRREQQQKQQPMLQPQTTTHIDALMLQMADDVGELTGQTEYKLRTELNDLREQLALLRVELTTVRASIASGNVRLLGDRNAA